MTSDELYNEFTSLDVFNHPDYQQNEFYPGEK